MRRLPVGGQQCGDVPELHLARENGEDVGQVADGVDPGELAAAEQGVCDGSPLRTSVAPCEQVVLPSKGGADVEPLDDAVVDGDGAVIEEASERLLVVERKPFGQKALRQSERRRRYRLSPER